ncbi:MAG: hypothetical protein ACRD09_13240 [Vicinamibacterales bacterium]
MQRVVIIVLCTFSPAAALAQPAYVGASLVGDIGRFTSVEIDPATLSGELTGGGETLGFGLVVGTALGDRWGVELEFVRPGVVDRSARQRIGPLPANAPVIFPIPIIEYEVRFVERHTTLTTAAWFRQSIGDRADLCYLGGIAFVRTSQERGIFFEPRLAVLPIPSTQTITEHTVGPMVGVEGRIRLTDQLVLVPGVRLLAIAAAGREGWLIRPGVGLQWRF